MAVRTHYDIDWDAAILAALVILQAAVDDLDADVVLLQADVDAIQALVEAEAILEETGGSLTTDGTEQTVYVNNAPAGVYCPKELNINFTNQTAGETVVLRTYYRNVSGGAWVEDDELEFAGVPDELLVWIDLHRTRFGIKVTIEKTGGANRAYVWEVFYKV